MELREMSESCENQEKDVTLNGGLVNAHEASGDMAAETTVTDDISEGVEAASVVNNIEVEPDSTHKATDYSALDKHGLVAALEEQLQKPIESIRDDVNLIKVAFYSVRNAEIAAEKEEFVSKGNEESAFAPREDADEVRFKELQREIPDISQKMLTVTLRTLESDGYVTRTVYPEVPPRVEYALTPRTHTLLPHIDALMKWAIENNDSIINDRKKANAKNNLAIKHQCQLK